MKLFTLIAAAFCLLLLSGCETARQYSLTCKLWNNTDLRNFREPAPHPNLKLHADDQRDDVLVQYDELSESSGDIRRRGYFLGKYVEYRGRTWKPRFESLEKAVGLREIPIVPSAEASTQVPTNHYWQAVAAKDEREFTLYFANRTAGPYELPVYAQSGGTVIKVLATPLAAAGDTIMVGIGASIVWLYGMAAGGYSSH